MGSSLTVADTAVAATPPVARALKAAAATTAPDTAPDFVTAQINARASKHRVEVLSERTETTQIFVNADGSISRETATAPVRVEDRDAKNGWRDIDLDLEPSTNGTIAPKSPLTDVAFSSGGTSDADLVEVKENKQEGFSLDWKGVLPKPTIDGPTATYTDVAPSTDLVVTATRYGFEQSFVIKERPADPGAVILPLSLSSDGLAIRDTDQSDRSGMTIKNDEGKTVGHVSPATTWDGTAKTTEQPAETTVSDLALDHDDSGTTLTVAPDATFLSDPKTDYPVVIDPSFAVGDRASISDNYVRSDAPSTQYLAEDQLKVGTNNSGTSKYRAFLKFVGPQPTLGTAVTSATLKMYEFDSYSCTASQLDVWGASNMDFGTVSWTNQPALTSTKTSITAAKGYSTSCQNDWVSVNVRAIAQNFADDGNDRYIFALRASETANSGYKRFSSSESANPPVLTVTYDRPPTNPTGVAASGAAVIGSDRYVGSGSPTLTASAGDPDGESLKIHFDVYDGNTLATNLVAGCDTAYVAPGAPATCNVSPSLSDNKTYNYTATALSSANSMQSGGTLGAPFKTSLSSPPAPQIDCPTRANGSWAAQAPADPVACTVSVSGVGGNSAASWISLVVDSVTVINESVKMGSGSTKSFTVPRTDGPHNLLAGTTSPAGRVMQSSYAFGFGSAAFTSPSSGAASTNTVSISASAPPRGSGAVNAVLGWRAAGSTLWNDDTPVSPDSLQVGDGVQAVKVNAFRWSLQTASGPGLNVRRPTLLEIRICFNYTNHSALRCTNDSGAPLTVLRVPHAFGDSYPTATAGDGSVALWTGEFTQGASDVDVPTPLGNLAVSRVHSTLADPTDSVTNVFGPGWTASFASNEDPAGLQVVDSTVVDGTISFTSPDDDPLVFREPGGGNVKTPTDVTYTPADNQTAASGFILRSTGSGSAQRLTITSAHGSQSAWAVVNSAATSLAWTPLWTAQAANHSTETYTTEPVGSGSDRRVSRILAPVADGVTCDADSTKLVAGCSALLMNYAEPGTTPPTGSSIGAFANRLMSIDYITYDSSVSSMNRVMVATYAYDNSGRLVLETDPRSGKSVRYGYEMRGSNLVLKRIANDGLAPYTFNYEDNASMPRLKSVQRDAAGVGGQVVTTSSYAYRLAPSSDGLPSVQSEMTKWGQARTPTTVAAVFGLDHPVVGTPSSSDWPFATLHYADDDGYETDTATYGAGHWLTSAQFYDAKGRPSSSLGPVDTEDLSSGAITDATAGRTFTRYNSDILDPSDGTRVLVGAGTYPLDTWGPVQSAKIGGQVRQIRLHTHYDYDEGAPNSDKNPATGEPYQLVTAVTVGASDPANYSENAAATLGADLSTTSVTKLAYIPIDGASVGSATSGWTLGKPTLTTVVMSGTADDIVRKVRYDEDGNILESREPGSTGADAGTTKTLYYTGGLNSQDSQCGSRPQWTGLLCWSGPAAPPESGVGIAATRVINYDRWLNQTQTSASSSSGGNLASRTTTKTYLGDGRLDKTSVVTAGVTSSTSLPATRELYDSATKMHIGTANLSAGDVPTSSVTSAIDFWGRTTSYTDATGNTTATNYVAPGTAGAGAVGTVTDSKGSRSYSYDGVDAAGKVEHRGLATQLSVSGLGTFAAAYGPLGGLIKETMPGLMSQQRTYDRVGRTVGLTYTGQSGPWLGYSRTYNGAGTVDGDSDTTGRSLVYSYDLAARLKRVADSSSSSNNCTTRSYSFDARGNRTSLASTSAATCTLSGAATRTWAYDAYSRQQTGANGNGNYTYDSFGRQVSLPLADSASSSSSMTSIGYYDNDSVRTISQGGVTTTFELDPAGRRLTTSTSSVSSTNAYADESDNPSWVSKVQGSTSTVSRYINDLAGGLANVDTTGASTTGALGLATLSGTIAATVPVSSSGPATGITSYFIADEYGRAPGGAATTGAAAYGWAGVAQRAASDSGLVLMGARLYNPSTGRFTSTDPIDGGNENAYAYATDPINSSDYSGLSTTHFERVKVPGIGYARVTLTDAAYHHAWRFSGDDVKHHGPAFEKMYDFQADAYDGFHNPRDFFNALVSSALRKGKIVHSLRNDSWNYVEHLLLTRTDAPFVVHYENWLLTVAVDDVSYHVKTAYSRYLGGA